ncbi:hypothetical protein ACLB2K_018019 [Fragaria x ananassa]
MSPSLGSTVENKDAIMGRHDWDDRWAAIDRKYAEEMAASDRAYAEAMAANAKRHAERVAARKKEEAIAAMERWKAEEHIKAKAKADEEEFQRRRVAFQDWLAKTRMKQILSLHDVEKNIVAYCEG